MGQDPKSEFGELLTVAWKQLEVALSNWANWEALWPTEEAVDILNRYRDFFILVRVALIDSVIIKAGNLVSESSSAPSLYALLRKAEANPSIVSNLDTVSLRRRLNKTKSLQLRVKRYRDRRSAPWDIGKSPPEVVIKDIRTLLAEAEAIYKIVYRAFHNDVLSLDIASDRRNATAVVEALSKLRLVQRQLDDWYIKWVESTLQDADQIEGPTLDDLRRLFLPNYDEAREIKSKERERILGSR